MTSESSSSYNTSIAGHLQNERYDQLINSAKSETDASKRMDMLLEAEKILVEEDAGVAPWRFYGQAYLVETTITRFVDQPYGGGKDYSLWKLSSGSEVQDNHARRKRGIPSFGDTPVISTAQNRVGL